MSVIGRLDEQVDAILIAPLRRGDETHAPGAQAEDAASVRAQRNTNAPPEQTEPQSEKEAARDDATDELPVWLL
jgi:hypothetical protein